MVKQCLICGMTFEGIHNQRFCCVECSKRAAHENQKRYKRERARKRRQAALKVDVLAEDAVAAKEKGMSYGKYKAEEFAKTIKIERTN